MKKLIYTIIFIGSILSSNSQIWVEGFGLYSMPMSSWSQGGESTLSMPDGTSLTVENSEVFKTLADPSFGGGINVRYSKNQLIIGMEISYTEYPPATDLLRITMFRIGPMAEYFFLPNGKFHPYLGGEFDIIQPKAFYNAAVVNQSQLSKTYLGLGARAGFVYRFADNWAMRLGAKYVYLEDVPFLDVTLGLAVNLGDF